MQKMDFTILVIPDNKNFLSKSGLQKIFKIFSKINLPLKIESHSNPLFRVELLLIESLPLEDK